MILDLKKADSPGKPMVLVVDDTPDNLVLLVDLLKDDYQVKIANNGENAIKTATMSDKPDIILMDIMMPVMNAMKPVAC